MAWSIRPAKGAVAGLNNTATRATGGLICVSIPSHLLAIGASKALKPVMLPPGRARLATKPWPIGSATLTNTIGIVRVWRRSPSRDGVVSARSTSEPRATNSAA